MAGNPPMNYECSVCKQMHYINCPAEIESCEYCEEWICSIECFDKHDKECQLKAEYDKRRADHE